MLTSIARRNCSDDGDAAAGVLSDPVRDRSDEMNAVMRCFRLVSDVIGKRIRMCEHLFSQEVAGQRPVSIHLL